MKIPHRHIDGTEVKHCNRCEQWLPLSGFHKCNGKCDGLAAWCRECAVAYGAARYKANREKVVVVAAAWRKANPEKAVACRKAWAKANPTKVVAANAKWYEANRERVKASSASWKRANPDKMRALRVASEAKRRALIRGNGHSPYKEQAVWDRDAGVCQLCGIPISDDSYHIDHIIPISKGGPDTFDNVQLAHAECNLKKGASLEIRE